MKRKVVVLYENSLFGEGIAHLIESDRRIQVVLLDGRLGDTADQLRKAHPDIVIVEDDPIDVDVLGLLGEAPGALVIRVKLDTNVVELYCSQRLVVAQADDLRKAILTFRKTNLRSA